MLGADVYEILREKGVERLHHANSVTTSCSFLALRGLASRGAVEAARLAQTAQDSDQLDRQFGIWNDIFTDGVDLHQRARRRNLYGPVLFALPLECLLNLPGGFDVLVTKDNPIRWREGQIADDRYFASADDLRAGYSFGDFAKHVVIRAANGILPFPAGRPVEIVLDNANFHWTDSKRGVHEVAVEKLQNAANQARLAVNISPRACRPDCQCGVQGQTGSYDASSAGAMF